jgi:hypothetical protein
MEGGDMYRLWTRGMAGQDPDTFEAKAQDEEKRWRQGRKNHTPTTP